MERELERVGERENGEREVERVGREKWRERCLERRSEIRSEDT